MGRDAKGLSKGRYDEPFAGEDVSQHVPLSGHRAVESTKKSIPTSLSPVRRANQWVNP